MVIAKQQDQKVEQKEWENPLNPEKPVDERDREQLARQIKEARRTKEHLTEDENNNNETKN